MDDLKVNQPWPSRRVEPHTIGCTAQGSSRIWTTQTFGVHQLTDEVKQHTDGCVHGGTALGWSPHHRQTARRQ
jgi:hypothetical protein